MSKTKRIDELTRENKSKDTIIKFLREQNADLLVKNKMANTKIKETLETLEDLKKEIYSE